MAQALLGELRPVPALLDKDTVYGGFVEVLLAAARQPDGVREGRWYDGHVKVHEYQGLTAVAAEIRDAGCPVMLVAPFTEQIHDATHWHTWVARLGGEPVRLVWVRSDGPTLLARLSKRGWSRDAGKLDEFEAFVARMRPEEPPPVSHVEIDNRLGAAPPAEQVAAMLG